MNTTEQKTKKARVLYGVVTSTKMAKTVVVAVTTFHLHAKYLKQYPVTTKLKAHDETGTYVVGDRVSIEETRPMSKTKRWRILGKM